MDTKTAKDEWERRENFGNYVRELFCGWFNNHMTLLLFAVQRVQAKSQQSLTHLDYFLSDIEHHYMAPHAALDVRHAFRYLHRYLGVYPQKVCGHGPLAIEMIRRIHQELGFDFDARKYLPAEREDLIFHA